MKLNAWIGVLGIVLLSCGGVAGPAEPTGCAEFEVELPRATGGVVLRAADFGLSETGTNNVAALNAAFAAAKSRRASRVVVAPGRYPMGAGLVEIEDLTDFTFDGGGATFVSLRTTGSFLRVQNSTRIRLANFALDWDWSRDPLASVARIVEVDKSAQTFTVELPEYREFPRRDGFRVAFFSPFDLQRRAVGRKDGGPNWGDQGKNRPLKIDWLSPNTFRIHAKTGLRAGEYYRLQHYYYNMGGLVMTSNRHITLDHVTILSTPGHALLMGGTQAYTRLTHVDIVPPKDDPRRVITCTADHFHISSSCGYLKIEDCDFSLGADDCLNVHDCTTYARAAGPRTLRTVKLSSKFSPGDRVEIRHDDYTPTGFTGTLVRLDPVPGEKGTFEFVFQEELPAPRGKGGFVLFNRRFGSDHVIVRDSHFHDNRARGIIIQASDVTVERCRFAHIESSAMKITTGYTFKLWCEGYGATNVVVRDCTFDGVNVSRGGGAYIKAAAIYTGTYRGVPSYAEKKPLAEGYPIVSGIRFVNNVFTNMTGVAAYVSGTSDIVFEGNRFYPLPDTVAASGELFLDQTGRLQCR